MTTLPEMTRVMDDEFVTTWYEIRAESIDNILDATVVSAAFRDAGCYKTQVGSTIITRTIRYGKKTPTAFSKGSVLPADEDKLETMGYWPWKYFTTPVTRSLIDDQQNAGPSRIKDYVKMRLGAAREGIVEYIEDIIMADDMHPDNDPSSSITEFDQPYSLYDFVPYMYDTNYFTSSYKYGQIPRDFTFWQHRDFTDDMSGTPSGNRLDNYPGPAALTIYDDMKNAHRLLTNNLKAPNLHVMNGATYELYENYVDSKDQLIKDATTRLADLGYDVLRFKGKPVVWTASLDTVAGSVVTYQALMLNTDWIDIIYDPNLWFDLSDWRTPERQMERIAYISCSLQILCTQLRTQARILWDT